MVQPVVPDEATGSGAGGPPGAGGALGTDEAPGAGRWPAGMVRRIAGALVLVVVLVGALVLGNASPPPLAGVATAVPVPASPQVGDCLLSLPPVLDGFATPGGVWTTFGSCGRTHYGEVYAVLDGQPGDGLTPLGGGCGGLAQFLGLAGDPDSLWHRMFGAGQVTLGPDPRQRAQGQSWIACVIVPPRDGTVPARYTGTVRGAFADNVLPAAFATCLAAGTDALPVSCVRPHAAEVLGAAEITTAMTPAQLDQSCRAYAAIRTGMPDVTAGGTLDPHALVYGTATSPAGAGQGTTEVIEEVECLVSAVGSRQLTGTLIGLGRNPVPWA